MEIETKSSDSQHIITLVGRVDAASVPILRDHIDVFRTQRSQNYIVDLKAVTFLDSAGMAVLVKLLKQARSLGGEVVLIWSDCEAANRILKLTRFDKVFALADDLDGAVALLEA